MTFPVHVGPSSITTNRDDRILICQPDGRITGEADGFFTRDTRFISGYDLWINGTRPILLGSGSIQSFSSRFEFTNDALNGLVDVAVQRARARDLRDLYGEGRCRLGGRRRRSTAALQLLRGPAPTRQHVECHAGRDDAALRAPDTRGRLELRVMWGDRTGSHPHGRL